MLLAIAATPVDQLHNECMAQKKTRAKMRRVFREIGLSPVSVARRFQEGTTAFTFVHSAYKF